MPNNKQKTYEYDYEWNGNDQPQKGVNIKEKNPWPTPVFASVQQPSNSKKTMSSTPVQAPTDIDELRQAHPWQKPQWATVDKSPKKKTSTAVDRDAIPKPMLKKTPGVNNTSTNIIPADEDAIAAMERKLAAAKQRQAELKQKGQAGASNETNEAVAVAGREKHVSEETKLERARRLAKEKELERWRATLKERNERDKAQRAACLVSHVLDDAAWQKPKEPPQQQQQGQEQEQQQQRPDVAEKAVQQDEVAVLPAGIISPNVVVQQHTVQYEPVLTVSPLSRRASLPRPAAANTTSADSSPRRHHHPQHDEGDDDVVVVEDPMAADLARQIAQLEWELQQLES